MTWPLNSCYSLSIWWINRNNWVYFAELDTCNKCHTKQIINYFEKNCFNYRAGSEGDKWEGFARWHFYNDIIRAKRISVAILHMPRGGKNKVAGLVFLWFFKTLFSLLKKKSFLRWLQKIKGVVVQRVQIRIRISFTCVNLCYLFSFMKPSADQNNSQAQDYLDFTILCFKIVQMWK